MTGFVLKPWMLAIGAAAGLAVYTAVLEYGVAWADVQDSVAIAATFYSTLVVTAGASSGGYRVGRLALGAFVLGGGFNFLAWLANFFAFQSGSVITVVPLLNTIPLLVMVITY